MKLNKGSYWLKSGAYTFMERFSLQLFRFGSFYFLVRGLSREHFGIWTIFLILSTLIEVARAGLVQNALVKFLSVAENTRVQGRINTASLTLNIVLTLISSLILFVMAQIQHVFWDVTLLDELIYVYILTTFALIPFYQFNFIQQANLDFKGIFYSNVVRQGLFFAYVLICFLIPNYPFRLIHLAAAQTVGAIAGSLVAYFMSRKYLFFSPRLDRRWLKWLLGYGKYVVGTNLGSMFIKTIDQLMLGVMVSPIAVAIYGTAIKITNLVEVPTQSIAAIVFPQSARRIENEGRESVKRLYEKSVGVILALIIPGIIFVLFFPEMILKIVAGESYVDAAPILRITMLYGLFVPFARQFGTMLDAMGKPKVNFAIVMLSALLNILFNYIFISRWGLIGAAYGTLITYLIVFIINQIILFQELRVQPFNTLYYAYKVYRNGFALLIKKLKDFLKL
ncbi:MAG: flippase [Bacteroidetes bacterium]|nr:flippase [Bacteroidota bacterium]